MVPTKEPVLLSHGITLDLYAHVMSDMQKEAADQN